MAQLMIKEFKGEYRWLSNFELVDIELDGVVYPSVEHAYMSQKSDDPHWRLICQDRNNTPGKIKKMSRNITIKENWDEIKITVMATCIYKKFHQEPFKSKLLNTGDVQIQEGNYWGDEFWGINLKTNTGENNLGKIIMKLRSRLQTHLSDK